MGRRELLVKRGRMGGETVSSMGGGKGDGGLAFWMLEVGRWGRGRGGEEGEAAFIEHWPGFGSVYFALARVASCFMTWLDVVVLSLAHLLESFNPGLKNVESKDFDVCVCV